MPTTALDIIKAAYRICGMTKWAGNIPGTDWTAEALTALNRRIGSWQINGMMIYTTRIDDFDLVSGQKIYTIGTGGDFDIPRPTYYKDANMVFPTDPEIRRPVAILNDEQWASITLQDIQAAPAYVMYCDMAYPLSSIYLVPQPTEGYKLELFTWQQIPQFSALSDNVVMPPGAEQMMQYTLAEDLEALNPGVAQMTPQAHKIAIQARDTWRISNTQSPKQLSPPEYVEGGRGYVNYLTGLNN